MSEFKAEETLAPAETSPETRHNDAIQNLLTKSAQAAEEYINSRTKDNKLFLKDINLAAGAMLLGLGIWQVLAGGQIPNVFESINILHLPGYNEMGQMIVDTNASTKIASGIGATLQTLDSYKPKSPQPGKIDFYLVKAYAMDYINKIGIRQQHNGQP